MDRAHPVGEPVGHDISHSQGAVSVLGMIWLWRDKPDVANMADHASATFWYVLPSLPMFLLIPALLRQGWGFWPSLVAACLLTIALYLLMTWIGPRFGIKL